MRFRNTATVVVLGLTLSGCSLVGDESADPPGVPEGAQRGGVLKVGITAPGGINPLDAYEPAGKLVSATMCDGLVAVDPVTGQLREALAKGWVLSDGGTVTVKLRHGVRFTDGRELRARDVNYSLQQLVAPANGAYAAGLATQFVAAAPPSKETSLLADSARPPDVVAGVNKYDFQVLPRTPDGGVLRAFAEPALAPVSQSAHDADPAAFERNPVCVGPYVLERPFRAGDREIRLKRSKDYYAKNVGYTGGGGGYADRIVFTVFPSSAAALAAYRAGTVDVVQVPRNLVAGTRDTASLVLGTANGVEYLGLPGGSSTPFGDPDVRIALSKAIDRTKLVAAVFGPAALAADGFEPPSLAISEGPSLEGRTVKAAPLTSCGDSTPAKPDQAGARARLAAAASRPDAKPLTGFTLEVNDDAPYPAMARELAAQWKAALGLNVKVVTTPWSAYVAKAGGSAGFSSAFRIRWSTNAIAPTFTYNNQQRFISAMFASESTNAGNWAHFSDRAVEFGLTEDAASMTDVAQRAIAFGQLTAILCREMPVIPLVFDRPSFLVRSTVLGSAREVPVGRDGVLLLRELFLK